MFTYNSCSNKVVQPFHTPVIGVVPVKQNQALTPAQIADYTAKGIAVSSSQNLVFDEGVPNPAPLPLEQRRGIDVADVWNASKTASKKLKSAIKSAKASDSQTN